MRITATHKFLSFGLLYVLALVPILAHAEHPEASVGKNPTAAPDDLTGIMWRVTELSGQSVGTSLQREPPFILFDAATRQVAGYTGCNRFFGGYSLAGATLTLGPIGSTKRACPDLEEGLETEFFKVLDATRRWEIVGGALRLLNGDVVLARLEKGPGS